jgi:dTDP-4-dehydrorhamnose 3,5-epimerase
MDEGWQPTAIPGVVHRTLTPHADARGALREAWRASWTADLDAGLGAGAIAQVNHTVTRAGALRGLHFHQRQSDMWVVLDGRAHVGLADLRGVLGRGHSVPTLSLELTSGECLFIPPLVAHGLWALTDVSLLYLVTQEYDGSDEHGFAWNDPTAAVGWPDGTPLLSERDRTAPDLIDVVERMLGD